MNALTIWHDAAIGIRDGVVVWIGSSEEATILEATQTINANGSLVTPEICGATHPFSVWWFS